MPCGVPVGDLCYEEEIASTLGRRMRRVEVDGKGMEYGRGR